jgi:hypothetical protein
MAAFFTSDKEAEVRLVWTKALAVTETSNCQFNTRPRTDCAGDGSGEHYNLMIPNLTRLPAKGNESFSRLLTEGLKVGIPGEQVCVN